MPLPNRKNQMKFLAAIVLSLALVGCSDTEPVSPSPIEQTIPSTDELYVAQLRDDNPSLSDVSDEQLISLGQEICSAFDRGVTFDEVAQITVDNGFSPENGGWMIGTAIGAYCPEHEGVIG